jgi:hypothetical protein
MRALIIALCTLTTFGLSVNAAFADAGHVEDGGHIHGTNACFEEHGGLAGLDMNKTQSYVKDAMVKPHQHTAWQFVDTSSLTPPPAIHMEYAAGRIIVKNPSP